MSLVETSFTQRRVPLEAASRMALTHIHLITGVGLFQTTNDGPGAKGKFGFLVGLIKTHQISDFPNLGQQPPDFPDELSEDCRMSLHILET